VIIAFWGTSATGKTTVAKRLAAKLLLPIRSCGDEIRAAAMAVGLSPGDAPDPLHRAVDDLTREWARFHSKNGAIVEGRFLDQVLTGYSDVILVATMCAPETRVERWKQRVSSHFDLDCLAELDKADELFRLRVYGTAVLGAVHIRLDTSVGGAELWTEHVLNSIGTLGPAGHG
jgi:cytidylate kinase